TPPGPGKSVRIGHQYDRNGTTIYQAAFIAGTGGVIGHCVDRNTRVNFETLVDEVMADPICQNADRVFWIVDNGSAHHPATLRWWLKDQYPTAIRVRLRSKTRRRRCRDRVIFKNRVERGCDSRTLSNAHTTPIDF